jgi:mannose-6-phosphate isomerase-like protein (cupin superfamily)
MSKASLVSAAAFPRVVPGPRDRATVEQLRQAGRVPDAPDVERDYRGCVVQKPWGFEFLAYDTPDVAVWRLRINAGHSTSMHCHPRKRTALLVLAGSALCHVFGKRFALAAHDVLVLEPGVFHATKAVSDQGLDLIEVETPRCKTDLVRLNDLYGREGAGYEGLRDMHTDRLDRFDHFSLEIGTEDAIARATYLDPQQRFELSIRAFDAATLRQWRRQSTARALVVLGGHLTDARGCTAATIGDALPPAATDAQAPAVGTQLVGLTLHDPRAAADRKHSYAAVRTGTYR